MPKLYIPKLKDSIRLTEPLTWSTGEWNGYLAHTIMRPDQSWNAPWGKDIRDITLEAGTVLQFKRYFISAQAKSDSVTVSIFAHPDRRLMPKKNGGTAQQMIKFDLPLGVLNTIEYEVVIP